MAQHRLRLAAFTLLAGVTALAVSACQPNNNVVVDNNTNETLVIYLDVRAIVPSSTPSPVATVTPGGRALITGVDTQAHAPNSPPPYGEGCINWSIEARTTTGALVATHPGPICVHDTWTITASPTPPPATTGAG